MTMTDIGAKIKEAQDFHREEAFSHHSMADSIGEAWGSWDIDRLLRLGVISKADADEVRAAQKANEGKQPTPEVYF